MARADGLRGMGDSTAGWDGMESRANLEHL